MILDSLGSEGWLMSDEKDTKGAVLGAYDCVPTVTCVAGVGVGMKHVNDPRAENKTNTLGQNM